jgi:hypothetical protein
VTLRALFLAASLALASTASSQQLRGIATADDGTVLVNALVRAQSAGGRVLAQTRTDDHGRYELRLKNGGRVLVDVLSLGYQRVQVGEVDVPPIGARELELRVARRRVALASLKVSAKRVCRTPQHGDSLFVQVLEQMQASIAASSSALADSNVTTKVVTFESERKAGDAMIRSLRINELSRRGQPPFAAWPADSLAKHGYVTDEADGSVFRAPDLATMASDEFVGQHCFRVQRRVADGVVAWALEFEPSDAQVSNRADVSGTLFASGEPLHADSMRFQYTGLPAWIPATAAMGWMRFASAGSLGPVLVDWTLRLPITGRKDVKGRDGLSRTTFSQQPLAVLGSKDVGGRTLAIARFTERNYVAQTPLVSVTLEASEGALPVLLASRFRLGGLDSTYQPTPKGVVELRGVIPGEYSLQIEPPAYRAGSETWQAPISIASTRNDRVSLKLSDERVLRGLCGAPSSREKTAAVVGVVRDSLGHPLPTDVQARWISSARLPSTKKGDRISAQKNTLAVHANSAGQFLLCDLPLETVTIRGDSVAFAGSTLVELSSASRVRFITLTLHPAKR